MEVDFYQIGVLVLQCVLISVLILFLFRIRLTMGIGLLYAALGLFQYMQVFLASTVYVEITNQIIVSPGSTVLFTGSLFMVLLIYIKEDALETRKIIYALLLINIIMSSLLFLFGLNLNNSNTYNPFHLSASFFGNNAWILFIGTLVLFVDAILIIILFEFVSKYLSNLFLKIYLVMFLVLGFDTFFFSMFLFWGSNSFQDIFISGLVSKSSSAVVYSFAFVIYLKYIENENRNSDFMKFSDIFYTLSYKQKFEIAKQKIKLEQKTAEKAIKLSQLKYQTLIDISPVGVFLTNTEGNTIYVNPQWSIITGLSHSEGLGLGWFKALHPDDKIEIEKAWTFASRRKNSSQAEYRFVHTNGAVIWVLGQIVPELDSDNKVVGYVGIITDITKIKNYEEELELAKEKIEESNSLKASFLQNMSHEIRTPLNAIVGFTSMLNGADLSEEERQSFISIIQNSSDQLVSIISDILTISSLETKQETKRIEKINVNNIIEDLLAIFTKELNDQKIKLSTKKGLNSQQSEIYSDKIKITQVLTNLITNALKFTSQGFVEFGYKLDKNRLEFYVKDTGIGIKKELHDKIFERFRQGTKLIQINYGGTGLGLSISKGFVEMLGGEIWVQSELGKGATFYFTIPYNNSEFLPKF